MVNTGSGVLQHDNQPFLRVRRKYVQFGDDRPHDMRSVLFCMERQYGTFYTGMALRAALYLTKLPKKLKTMKRE